jgi:hypothetical protein
MRFSTVACRPSSSPRRLVIGSLAGRVEEMAELLREIA